MNRVKTMRVFHGTNCYFDEIDLKKSDNNRDFGIGFYTTTLSTQAESWASTKRKRSKFKNNNAYVMVFNVVLTNDLKIKRFASMNEEWLEFIKKNRVLGGIQHDYDIVIGPVADDDTFVTVTRYMEGAYTAKEAIERLKFKVANDQVSFHTEKAIKCLTLSRRYNVE